MKSWTRASNVIATMFGALLGANVLTMSAMNFFEMSTRWIPLVYLALLAAMTLLVRACRIEYPALTKREHVFCITLALILFIPRSPYLIEYFLGYALTPIGDDPFHIPDLASIIYTEVFPPRSTYDRTQYLAYYYAAWIPGAVIYHAGLTSTVKQTLALLDFVYAFFIGYFVISAAKVLFADNRMRTSFIVVCMLYGGFDFLYWISSLDFVPKHSEWWAADFGFELQFSNFFTLALYTPQHFLAALSILFGLYVVSRSTGIPAQATSGLLFLSGLFSSPFSTLGAIPLVAWYFIRARKLRTVPVSAAVFAIVSLPLWWILLGNEHVEFQLLGALRSIWPHYQRAAFAVFLLVILLELGPLIAAAGYFVRSHKEMTWPFIFSLGYILSTFFFFYHGNYSMRGSIVPIFTLAYLGTPVVLSWYERAQRHRWALILLATYLLGGVLEYASFSRTAIKSLIRSDAPFYAAALESNLGPDTMVSVDLASDAERYEFGWQLLEKNKPIPMPNVTIDEARLMHHDNSYRLTLSRVANALRAASRR